MPIYEYRCSSCGHELESLQKLSDPPLVVCPACQKEALVKLVSAAGFQLKGTGWYVTDFRGNSGSSAGTSSPSNSSADAAGSNATASTSTASTSPSSASSTSDSKPAAA